MKKLPILLAVCLVLSGCNDPYGASLKAGADIASGIGQGMIVVNSLRTQGVITQLEEANVLGYLEFANKADEAFVSCATSAHTAGSKGGAYTACAQTFNATLNNPQQLALIKVNDPKASATISNIVSGVTAAITAVQTALGGK